jgi:hypothetical protein
MAEEHYITIQDLEKQIEKSTRDIDDPEERVKFLKTMLIIATVESKRLTQGIEEIINTSDPSSQDVLARLVDFKEQPSMYDQAAQVLEEDED